MDWTQSDVVGSRYAVPKFSPAPIPLAVVEEILGDAALIQSDINSRQWTVHIVSDANRRAISESTLWRVGADQWPLDLISEHGNGAVSERENTKGGALCGAVGKESSDIERGQESLRDNLRFHGAPHVAFLFMPIIDDKVRPADDIGAYAHAFLQALQARNYHGVAQTEVTIFSDVVRDVLGVSDELELVLALSFGTVDPDDPVDAAAVSHS